MHITGKKIILRSLVNSDFDFVLSCENDTTYWNLSGRKNPLSKNEWLDFLRNTGDFFSDGQWRLVICSHEGKRIGLIDLFDLNRNQNSAFVGLLIAAEQDRRKGYAWEAVELFAEHAFSVFRLQTIRALVHDSNTASVRLFSRLKFLPVEVSSFDNQPATVYSLSNSEA